MNINGISKSIKPFNSGLNIRRRIFELIPKMSVNDSANSFNLGNIINRPDVNRGIMGATALLTQPYIDAHNPHVDKETAQTSMFRTIGKILAGTTVGCIVRSACYTMTNACTNPSMNVSKWRKLFMPSERMQQVAANQNGEWWFKSYKNVLATTLSLVAMLATNVMFDVPLTSYISKKLMEWRDSRKSAKEGKVT